jgi:hypothetical protein
MKVTFVYINVFQVKYTYSSQILGRFRYSIYRKYQVCAI